MSLHTITPISPEKSINYLVFVMLQRDPSYVETWKSRAHQIRKPSLAQIEAYKMEKLGLIMGDF